jgi:hypothetical protein
MAERVCRWGVFSTVALNEEYQLSDKGSSDNAVEPFGVEKQRIGCLPEIEG